MLAPVQKFFACASFPRTRLCAAGVAFCIALLTACSDTPSREEQEAAKNTVACSLDGARLVMRFDVGEVRLLTAEGQRITLYQMPTPSGMLYSNGDIELRGKLSEMVYIDRGIASRLQDCAPYTPPK